MRDGVPSTRIGDLLRQLERSAKRNQSAEISTLITGVRMDLMRVEVFVEYLRLESAS